MIERILGRPEVNSKSDDENEQDLGPANVFLYVAKFKRLSAPEIKPTQYPDKSKFDPDYTEQTITFGGCTE